MVGVFFFSFGEYFHKESLDIIGRERDHTTVLQGK